MGLGVDNIDLTKFERANKSRKNFYTNVGGEIVPKFGTREQIARDGQSTGTNNTLFTVPTGRVLYITSAFLTIAKDVTSNDSGLAIIRVDATRDIVLLAIRTQPDVTLNESVSISFPTPIRVEVGDRVRVLGDANNTITHGGFVGFVEDEGAL